MNNAPIPQTVSLPRTSLWFNLQVSATRYPDKPAVVFFDRSVTFRQLHDDSVALAGWLQHEAGVQKGDRVGIFMQNSPQWITAFYAVMRADAVVVPLNPMNRTAELTHIMADAGITVMLCGHDLAVHAGSLPCTAMLVTGYGESMHDVLPPDLGWPTWVIALGDSSDLGTTWRQALAFGKRRPPRPHQAGPDDMALLPYTSGTTGAPKGCVHLHRNAMHNIVANALWAGTNTETVVLSALPLCHVAGMLAGMLNPTFLGCTVVLQPRWDREQAAQLIERYRVTSWSCITTMLVDFLEMPDMARYDLSSLQRVGGGGAAMPAAVAQRLQDSLGLSYGEGYGLTETMGATHRNPAGRAKRQCLGIPFIGTRACIIDPETLRPMPQGEKGEIIVCGPQVFQGYWRNEKATAEGFIDLDGQRYFRTGDIGYVDEEGYYFLTDRIKRMINASGFKVWPAEVEAMLYDHPDIREACVISGRDAYRGETVKALVVLRELVDSPPAEAEIIAWMRSRLAAYKCPRIVEFVPSLPKSNAGKVMWRELQIRENALET
jgi:fatty-acyl-CoA synthase